MKNLLFVFVFFIWAILLPSSAQDLLHHKKLVPDEANVTSQVYSGIQQLYKVLDPTLGDTIAKSNYDFWGTSVIPNHVIRFNNASYYTAAIRPWQGNTSLRGVAYIYPENGSYQVTPAFNSSLLTGYPSIDFNGTYTGISATQNSYATWQEAVQMGIHSTPVSKPVMQFINNTIFLAGQNNNSIEFYKSEDYGATWVQFLSLSQFHPNIIYSNSSGDMHAFRSENFKHIGFVGTSTGEGEVFDGISADSADNVWIIYSNDAGTTWNAEVIAQDGVINLVENYHTPNFAPIFENFGQVRGVMDNSGVIHIVANGYGVVFNSPTGGNITGSSFPVLYWNSNVKKWIAISNQSIDNLPANILANSRPGNNIGQSYPAISVLDEGHLFVTWTGPQVTNGTVDISNNVFMTDLFFKTSYDSGKTWRYSDFYFDIANKKNVSETYGHAALFIDSYGLMSNPVELIYLEDLSAGVNILGQGDITDNPIVVRKLGYPSDPLSAYDQNTNPGSYRLEQNYPNPFNPSTNIRYAVSDLGFVSLKIYDILGNEISTLVNEVKEAGEHTIQFNASSLSSGIYFYRITTTSGFTAAKKMQLMK